MRRRLQLILLAILTTSITVPSSAQLPVPSFEEVVQRLAAVNASLETLRVEQALFVRARSFSFRRQSDTTTISSTLPYRKRSS